LRTEPLDHLPLRRHELGAEIDNVKCRQVIAEGKHIDYMEPA